MIVEHRNTILEKLDSGEIFSGKWKHQRNSLVRPGDTRWGSHFTTLLRIENMWDSVSKVLFMVHGDECNPSRAAGLLKNGELYLCFEYEVDVESASYY